MVDFILNNKDRYGVEAICRILPIAASTYYRTLDLTVNPEHRAKRDLHDLQHAEEIKRIWKESSGRYGVRKVWQQLKREGYVIARCTVARLKQRHCNLIHSLCILLIVYIIKPLNIIFL